ncbi:choice-of-anchor Q domain-containing protein, partial [uncultured Tenacibaculum sp.]|uniref:InlB B-repeat-containing protein n=1 Tax=uncultured Tenacibaculum sp. TaxID=174713 RepID=UPI00261D7A4D
MKIKLCLLFLFTCLLVKAQIYVDKDATGSNDGSSWINAYTSLQDALANDSSGDEIWIAEGDYSPGTNRTDSFILNQTNVKLYGGFNGTESLLSERNVLLYKTILDGDVNGDDTGVGYTGVNRDENTLNIVKIQANNCTLDGIIIANGHANDSSISDNQEGSAILIDAQNISIKNSTFEKNVVQRFGVIQMIDQSGFLSIENTIFKDNYGNGGVTLYTRANGGALNITIINSLFENNTLENVSPSGSGSTGIIWFRQDLNFSQNVTITNCTLVNNKNKTRGTANVSVPATLINASRLSSNTRSSSLNVFNSIFWGNRNAQNGTMTSVGNDTSQTGTNDFVVETSVGEDNFNNFSTLDFIFNVNASTANISNANPIFTSSTDFTLQSSSPFVNNGDSSKMPSGITTDLLGNERIQSLSIDYGCYESSHTTNFNLIFVDKDATGNNDGSSWTNAYTDLQDALANDASNNVVWIAEGTYSPGAIRTDSFVLDQSNVKLYGGFNGTESQLSDRDFTQYKTVLDGDVNGDDSGVGYTGVNRTDNTIHIVKIQADNCILDGLTIANGQADKLSTSETQEGSALLIQSTNLTVKNCSIEKNVVSRFGVVQMIDQNGFLNIENTIFKNNFGNGGVTLYTRASNDILDINIMNCLFENNILESINPTGQGNSGIIWFRQDLNFSQRVTITNCTFAYNKNNTNASNNATLINASRISSVGQLNSLHVYNSIIWENRNAANNVMISMLNDTNQLDFQEYKVGNSVGQDGFSNISNTTGIGTSNPSFTNALNGDFTLKSNSPAIDTGDNSKIPSGIFTFDLQGNDRIFNTTVDMGAYEYNPSLTNQYTLTLNAVDGTITPNPAGGTYDDGSVVTLTATPDSGYEFTGWSGDASGTTNPLTITMDADKTVTANFGPIQRTLTLNATNGSVTVAPNPSTGTYDDGSVVTLTATPDSGYEFTGWSGDASGTTNPLNITMDADKTVTANFGPIQRT